MSLRLAPAVLICCALALSVLVAGCDRAPASSDYFPLASGQHWTYTETTERDNSQRSQFNCNAPAAEILSLYRNSFAAHREEDTIRPTALGPLRTARFRSWHAQSCQR